MKLRHVADVRNSNVDKIVVDGEHPVRLCNYVDVYKNDFINADMEFNAGSATSTEIASFGLHESDVIITKDSEDRTDIGVPALVRTTAPDLVCGYHLSILRAKSGIGLGPFLFWALQSKPAREAFSNAAYGITRYGMTLGGMKDVSILLPDLASQKAIADFLDRETARIDQLIEKKQRLVEVLSARHSVQLWKLVAGAEPARPERSDTSGPWPSSLPNGWLLRKIFHFADVGNGSTPSRENTSYWDINGLPWLNSGVIHQRQVTASDHGVTEQALAECHLPRVTPNTVLVAITGQGKTRGSAALCMIDATISQHLAYVRIRDSSVMPEFLYQALRVAYPYLREQSSGSGSTRAALTCEFLKAMKVPSPPISIQKKIISAISRIDEIHDALTGRVSCSIDRLREYRAALITAAVTGQIDLANYGKQGATDRTLDRIEEEMGG